MTRVWVGSASTHGKTPSIPAEKKTRIVLSVLAGKTIAEKIVATYATCPIPEVARLGRTLRTWRAEFLGYFNTGGASNGGTEAMNGLIELHRRIARGFRNRDNYRLRMLLIGGGLPL